MERAVAIKKLGKILGKSLGYRVDPKAQHEAKKGMEMSLNEEQRGYMRYLATVPASKKCWCAWYMADECPNCKGRGTLEDRLKVQCAGCNNYPSLYDRTKITHRIGCSSPDWQPGV
jgi:predicted nucleic acid binding AN1-type Zn finger protein